MLLHKSLCLLLLVEGVRNTLGYVQPNVSNFMSINSRVHHPSTTSTHLFAVKRCERNQHMASSNLFSSRGMRERACSFDITSKAGLSPNNEDDDQSLFQKVCGATLGRLKAILIYILKLIFVVPFKQLKSILTKKDKTDDGSEETDEVEPEILNVVQEAKIATDDATDDEKKGKVLTKVDVEWTKETLGRIQKIETKSAPDEKVADDVVEEPVVEISAPSLEDDVPEDKDSVEDEIESAEETPEAISEQVDVIEETEPKDEIVPISKEVEEDIENEEMNTEPVGDIAKEETEEAFAPTEVEPVTTDASDKVSDAVESPINEDGKAEEVEVEVEVVTLPKGEKWAVAAPNVDLTGKWKIIVSDEFKSEYDGYLKNLGQPSLVRSVAVSIVEMTTEEVIQSDDGRALCIKGKNLRGIWERTLIASGSDVDTHHDEDIEHTQVPLVTADKENVVAESWWEKNGTVHRSWLRGVRKYGGGDFESRRFLTGDGNRLVCESEFHPQGGEKDKAVITWTFERIG